MKNAGSVKEFMKFVYEGDRNTLYRGLESSDYEISSAALRRIDPADSRNVHHSEFVETVKALAEKARLRGHHIRAQEKRSYLELLADLQHFGAATCLIDFSKNPLIALWFACQNAKQKQGKVVAVDAGDHEHFAKINSKSVEEKDIDALLYLIDKEGKPADKFWIWEPQHQNERIIAQQSAFVFGKGKMADVEILRECFVQNKPGILRELEKLGISEEYLFCDIHGYSRVHAHDKCYQADDYFDMARNAHASGKYDFAIHCYNKAEEAIRKSGERNAQ